MYKLNNNILIDRVYNPKVYLNGKEYFSNNKVKNVKTNHSQDYFEGVIEGSKKHISTAEFNRSGIIKATNCDCLEFEKYIGDCKHIIALLLFIKEYEDKKQSKVLREKELKNMISYYEHTDEVIKRNLKVEYNLEINPGKLYEYNKGAYLSLRIGDERLYSVRDHDLLFEHLDSGEQLRFGQQFTLNPQVHRFKEEDMKVINFIRILHENFANYENSTIKGIFQNKRIYLTPTALKSFFQLMKNREFNFSIGRVNYDKVDIVPDDIPFTMNILEEDENLSVSLNSDEETLLLTPDAHFIFSGDKIYEIAEERRKKILPIYNQIVLKGQGEIKVTKDYKESFIADVLPNIKDIVNLNIDEKLEKMIYRENLKVEIFFDKLGDSIIGRIEFKYGKFTINPFSSKKETNKDKGKILIRDKEKEGQILSILEDGEFRVLDGGIYLDKDEEIFDLVANVIPLLQKYSEIYYSDSFSDISIRNPSYFSGGVKVNGDLDLLEFDFNIDGINIEDLNNVFRSIKEKKKFYRLKDGSFLPLDNAELNNVVDLVEDLGIHIESDRIHAPKYMTMYLDKYLQDKNLDFIKQNDNFKKMVTDINSSEEIEYEIPREVEGILRDYQKSGFKWLKTMDRYGFGGILADDMGLGKTLQIISFLLSEKREKASYPSLIVVPTSLVFNWEEEITKFAPELNLILIHGNRLERKELIKNISEYDVVITSYPLIRNDIELYKDFIFRYCILDEAQHIKNSNSLNAKSVKSINAGNYFALTGTPMENSVMELWSIFDFLMPGYLLSNKKFIDKFERPIFRDQNLERLNDLNKHIRPFILRRLKKDVLKELPEKIEQRMLVEMTVEQKKLYLAYIKTLKEELDEEINNKGFNRSHFKILTALTRLRQICCDPGLFVEDYTGGSGKVDSFEELIEDAILGGHRILVFSQFTSMLDRIKLRLDEKDIKHLYLNGSTPMASRGEMVREFNQGYGDIFLISLKAGGSGLNLTGADMVIHFDPWWNPAVEDQATDRAYRIGQENTVQVIKLITKGTIEEKIFKLQERKKEMIDMVIQEGETLISKLSEEEILSLFEV